MKGKLAIDLKFDLKTGRVRIYDDQVGIRSVDTHDLVAVIRDQLRLLKSYRDDGRAPSKQLLCEIRLYEFILAKDGGASPKEKAEAYFEKRHELNERLRGFAPKDMVAQALGWRIP
jgi:hypothetical protein